MFFVPLSHQPVLSFPRHTTKSTHAHTQNKHRANMVTGARFWGGSWSGKCM